MNIYLGAKTGVWIAGKPWESTDCWEMSEEWSGEGDQRDNYQICEAICMVNMEWFMMTREVDGAHVMWI